MKRREGFTLIELLVAVVLMMILLSAVTLIFVQTTDTIVGAQANTTIYTQARYALDTMENDLLGCLPFVAFQAGVAVQPGGQNFMMINGRTDPPMGSANVPIYGQNGYHWWQQGSAGAADKIVFRTTTAVGNTTQTVEISYELIPGSQTLRTTPLPVSELKNMPDLDTGDTGRGATVRDPIRPLYTLVRRVRGPDTANPTLYNQPPKDSFGNIVPDAELCYFVVSFNLEYYAKNHSMSQLDDSPFTDKDPLGDGLGVNDGEAPGGGPPPPGSPSTALRVPFIRVTLVLVEDTGALQERTIQKTIWIPVG